MKIIIYGSQYGTSKQYADELSIRTGIKAVCYEKSGDINSYDTIIYIGGLYAGGILGMKKTLSRLSDDKDKKLIIATVGLADPADKDNTANIRMAMTRQLSPGWLERAKVFHLRGGIDYSKLTLKHRAMMGMMYRKVKSIPEEIRTSEIKAMIDTYNKSVDFVDFDALDSIVNEISTERT